MNGSECGFFVFLFFFGNKTPGKKNKQINKDQRNKAQGDKLCEIQPVLYTYKTGNTDNGATIHLIRFGKRRFHYQEFFPLMGNRNISLSGS